MECEFRINDEGTKGYVLIMAIVFTTIMLIMGLAIIYLGQVERSLTGRAVRSGQALQLAEAGIERTIWRLRAEPDWTLRPPTNLWTNEPLGAGTYSVVLSQRSRHRMTVTSTGRVRDRARAVQVKLVDRGNAVGFWKFEEGLGSVAHDSTRSKNHGEIEEATWINDPRRGSVLRFDGDEAYVAIYTEPPFNLTHEITLDHWFQTTFSQNDKFMVVNGEPWNGEPGLGFFYGTHLTNLSRTLSFYVRLRNGGVRAVSYTRGGPGFRDGDWHRVTGTFDGRYLRLYHNGVLRGTTDIGTTDTIASDHDTWPTLYFARWGESFFRGDLDEIRITDRALLPGEF